jgi:hypothetical protein
MKLNDLFPSRYLKSDDYQQPAILTMTAVAIEQVGPDREDKPVLYFKETAKGLILNKTNFEMVAEVTGQEDTMDWEGQKIEIFKSRTKFGGRTVDCLRLRAPNGKQRPLPLMPERDDNGDDIPDFENIPDPGEPVRTSKRR